MPDDKITASPLATWDPSQSDAFDSATVGIGKLTIVSGCVRLLLDNQKTVLLVWPEPTTWNAASQQIDFKGTQGERLALQNGALIMPGGSILKGPPPFVLTPTSTCKADETFIVSSVSVVEK